MYFGKGDAGIYMLVEDILSMNTGINLQDITADTVLCLPELTSIIKKIIKNYRSLSLQHLVSAYCQHDTHSRSETSPDTCKITVDDIAVLLRCAPPEADDDNHHQEALLQLELQSVRNKPLEDVPPLGWKQVFALTLAVLRRVIPSEVWGSAHNLCVMKRAIKNILMLGRFDKLYLGNLLGNIKTNCCRWAASLESFSKKTYIISKVYLWIIVRLVMSILHSFMYVTETYSLRYQLVFYRKSVWQKQHDKAVCTLIKSGTLRRLNKKQVELISYLHVPTTHVSQSTEKKSFPRIRFLPKLRGVRPIIPVRRFGILPSFINKARLVLNELCTFNKKGSVATKSASGLQFAWRDYVKKLATCQDTRPLYFVRADVQDAYGSIVHSKLFELLQESSQRLPHILKFGQYSALKRMGQTFSRPTFFLLDDKGQPTCSLSRGGGSLVEMGAPLIINTNEVLDAIKKLVCAQVLSNGLHQRLLVTRGLPQGGVLSGVLCEFYYSSVCATHLAHYNTGTSILMRAVDDFLFLSTSHNEAERFLEQLNYGMPDFNCYINKAKTVHNLYARSEYRVSFAGVIVCLKSCQLLVDTSRVVFGHPRYSLRLNQFKAPGYLVANRLQQVSLARLPPHIVDPSYTKLRGLICNVWRAGFMAGIRLLTMLHTLLAPRGPVNANFITSTVVKVGHKVCRHIRAVWRRADVELKLPSSVILIAYIGGICVMQQWPGKQRWPDIHSRLKGIVKHLRANVPDNCCVFLPTLPSVHKQM
ncbi:uncharacterized protein [Panulirus ornatus]|uniref:uncharacterized protein isoform X2 n=1 Tax=Panulirus ornatus TaxID=150431 RepID=UPI003A8AD7A7